MAYLIMELKRRENEKRKENTLSPHREQERFMEMEANRTASWKNCADLIF